MEFGLGYWRRLQLQLFGSALAGVVLAVLVRLAVGVEWSEALLFALPLALAAAPLSTSAGYLCRALPLSRTPAVRLALAAAGAAVVSGILWAGAGYGWWGLLSRSGWVGSDPAMVSVVVVLVAAFGGPLYLLSMAVHYLVRAFEESVEASQRVLASEIAHRDAELRALRAQVDPHFLFNSLNSISGLLTVDPVRARDMCQRLGDFLRESLEVGASARIPLRREVALAEQYLRIEQVRFGRRLSVETALAPEAADLPVPPLVLQPLVENAVRHGIATRLEGGTIEIAARRNGDYAVIDVRNPKDADTTRPGTGRGLDLVRRRVLAMFGSRAALTISSAAESYVVSVSVPVVREADEAARESQVMSADAAGQIRTVRATPSGSGRAPSQDDLARGEGLAR